MRLNRLCRKHLILVVCLLGTTPSNVTAAHIPSQSQLGGWAYIDRNNDGILAFSHEPNPEFAIGDVLISLFLKVGTDETLVSTAQTDDFGRYQFENVDPGTYVLRKTQPVEFVNGLDTIGVLYGLNGQPLPGIASAGEAIDNAFLNIVLTADVGGEYYNFGERGLAAGYVSKRLLLATAPELGPPPPPPPGGPPPPDLPEPTSLVIAVLVGCGSFLASRRSRRSYTRQLTSLAR